MRFASLNASGRGANYAAAGKAGADALADSFSVMRKTGPKYDELSIAAMQVEADKQKAAWANQAKVGKAGIKAMETVTKQGIVSVAQNTLDKQAAARTRKAGMLAGVSSVLGGAAVAAFGKEDKDDSWKDDFDSQQDGIDAEIAAILKRPAPTDSREPWTPKGYEAIPGAQGGSDPKSGSGSNGAAAPTTGSVGKVTTFDQAVTAATNAGMKYPRLAAAQWALESGHGKSVSGTHNYFGIKATGDESSTSKATWEVINGKEVNTTANFKNYNSAEEAFADLNNKWYRDYKNYKGVGNASSAEEAARALQQQGYATDPNYANKLIKIMNSN